MTAEKSISRRATRQQMLKVYALLVKERGAFNPANATKTFRSWFRSHASDTEQILIARYTNEILEGTEMRLRQIRAFLTENGFILRKGGE